MVQAIESKYSVRHTWIPFLGFVRFAVNVSRPDGVCDIQFAVFEHARFDDVRRVEELVRRNVGPGFQPLVQVHSNHSGECSLIYASPVGRDRVALLIFAHDRDDTTVVNLVVNVDGFSKVIAQPDHMAVQLRWTLECGGHAAAFAAAHARRPCRRLRSNRRLAVNPP